METLFKLTPISEVDLTTLPNNEDYYCEVWVIDDETPIGEPTMKDNIILRFKNGIFIDIDGNGWEKEEILRILLPVSEKQIGEKVKHYDQISDKIASFYEEDSDADLLTIGEYIASEFGYL